MHILKIIICTYIIISRLCGRVDVAGVVKMGGWAGEEAVGRINFVNKLHTARVLLARLV